MEAYTAMRHFADSWGLLALLIVFIAVIAFVFRRQSRRHYERAARIPLEDDDMKMDRS
jgi:cytochrome c oxidase cbb3-type subunit 4